MRPLKEIVKLDISELTFMEYVKAHLLTTLPILLMMLLGSMLIVEVIFG